MSRKDSVFGDPITQTVNCAGRRSMGPK